MALADPAFFGPAHTTDINAYNRATDNNTIWKFVIDGGKDYLESPDGGLLEVTAPTAYGTFVYGWPYIQECGLFGAGALTSGQVARVATWGANLRLELVQDGGDLADYIWRLFKISTSTVILTGTTRFTRGSYQEIRIEQRGTAHKLWVDGVLEGEGTQTVGLPHGGIILRAGPGMGTNNFMRYRAGGLRASDDANDRPDVGSIVFGAKYPSGDDGGAGQNQYSDEACLTDDAGTSSKWADWNGGSADDVTSLNCGEVASAEREISTLTNVTVSNVVSTYYRMRARANVDAKTVATWTIERDGSANETERSNVDLLSNTWRTRVMGVFDRQPDGSVWDQTALDDVRLGVRTIGTNGASDQWTAIFLVAWGMTTDPPATGRRRIMGSVS